MAGVCRSLHDVRRGVPAPRKACAIDRARPSIRKATDDACHVAIHDWFRSSKRDARDRARGVSPHTRQLAKRDRIIGNLAAMHCDDLACGGVQGSGTPVITETAPAAQHRLHRGASHGCRIGKPFHEFRKSLRDANHLRLLQKDLAHQRCPGRSSPAPRQIPCRLQKPALQGFGEPVRRRQRRLFGNGRNRGARRCGGCLATSTGPAYPTPPLFRPTRTASRITHGQAVLHAPRDSDEAR